VRNRQVCVASTMTSFGDITSVLVNVINVTKWKP